MKKNSIILFVFCILLLSIFSGCGIYSNIDLEEVKKEILELKTRKLDISKVKEVLKNSSYFNSLEEVDINSVQNLGISKENIDTGHGFLFMVENNEEFNSFSYTSYIIVKPVEDREDILKEEIDNYYKNLFEEYINREGATIEGVRHIENVMKKEYEGYFIYILSYNNEDVWKIIQENSHSLLFENPKELTLKEFSEIFSVKEEYISEYEAVLSENEDSVSLYVIVKPRSGKAESVKKSIDKYMNELEKKYETDIINHRIQTEVGSYLIYIVSKDNENILNTIKNVIVRKNG